MRRPLLFSFTVLLTACPSRSTPTPPAKTDAAIASTSASAEPRKPLPDLFVATRPGSSMILDTLPWPHGGKSVFALGQGDVVELLWTHDGKSDAVDAAWRPTNVIVRDVIGDGKRELVAYRGNGKHDEHVPDNTTIMIFGVQPDGTVARMAHMETMVLGATDEASLDAVLKLDKKLGPTKDVPLERVVARLGWATADEMRALVSPNGVKICKRHAEKKTCSAPIARTAIDGAAAKRIAATPGAFSAFVNMEHKGLQKPSCHDDDDAPTTKIKCYADEGGPIGGEWRFDKTPDGPLLAEVWRWEESS